MKNVIEVKGLTRYFQSVAALDGIDLNVEVGKVSALLGRNGAGKTTLIKILSGLILPSAGTVRVLGMDPSRELNRLKGLVSVSLGNEDRGFYWRLTGRQNLEFFSALYEIPPDKVRAKILELAEMFELEDLDKQFDRYSTGQKHRYCLARNFFNDPKIVLMDEPTRSLDPLSRRCLKNLIKKWTSSQGKSFFFTTHDFREAEELAGEITILHKGRIAYSARKETFNFPGSSLENIFYQTAGGREKEDAHVS